MIDDWVDQCTATRCARRLTEDCRLLTMRTDDSTRHVYECECGAVTITVEKTA